MQSSQRQSASGTLFIAQEKAHYAVRLPGEMKPWGCFGRGRGKFQWAKKILFRMCSAALASIYRTAACVMLVHAYTVRDVAAPARHMCIKLITAHVIYETAESYGGEMHVRGRQHLSNPVTFSRIAGTDHRGLTRANTNCPETLAADESRCIMHFRPFE